MQEKEKYSDFSTVEKQKNFLTAEEFPEGPYGSPHRADEPVQNKSTPWKKGQRSIVLLTTNTNHSTKTFQDKTLARIRRTMTRGKMNNSHTVKHNSCGYPHKKDSRVLFYRFTLRSTKYAQPKLQYSYKYSDNVLIFVSYVAFWL